MIGDIRGFYSCFIDFLNAHRPVLCVHELFAQALRRVKIFYFRAERHAFNPRISLRKRLLCNHVPILPRKAIYVYCGINETRAARFNIIFITQYQ